MFIRIGNVRLLIAVGAAVMAWFIFGRDALGAWWLLVPVVAFVALVIWHERVIKRRTLAERAIRLYDRGLARIKDAWAGSGDTGEAYRNADHVYAEDLDVFGKGSLFELISTVRTEAGERTLATWLLTPAPLETALARQEAVRELSGRLDLREDVALLGDDIRSRVNADELERWGTGAAVTFPAFFRPATMVLAIIGLTLLVLKLASVLPLWPLLVILGIDFSIIFGSRHQVAAINSSVETAAHDLSLLSVMIGRLEREQFASPYLRQLHRALQTDGLPASRRIGHLQRWMELLDSSDHVVMRILGPLLLWKQQIAAALEAWRQLNGLRVGAWVHALAELEALSSLATLAFERPQWTFPELDSSAGALFEASALQHPLMASSVSVANDVKLGVPLRLLVVSGSNMSGKSTLLRAMGLNTVLAWCGAPVAAANLRISPLLVGASIRVTDSLQDNRSRFFAEISRLRQIVELTRSGEPVLFLLDELLSGTNSHDRLIGAAGVVRVLLKANSIKAGNTLRGGPASDAPSEPSAASLPRSIGLLTTHDLALTQMEQELGAAMANVHFEDRIINGTVEFDYKLKPGVVTHSNALELMRSIGLDI